MADKEVRDKNNIIIGWCQDSGTSITGLSSKHGYVGFYVKSSDVTFDNKGNIFCYGDGVSDLIREAEHE